jgi:fumarylacetoacetate (FAA) hydrolase
MKLVTYSKAGTEQAALYAADRLWDTHTLHSSLASTMLGLLNDWDRSYDALRAAAEKISRGDLPTENTTGYDEALLLAPVPRPTSCRDGYAFRQHVASARRNRKVDMIPEFDQYPIFYFTNHNAITGPGKVTFMPDHFQKLDFELEAGVVIGKKARNIRASEADSVIAGYTIMNDWSARTLQMEEMLLNLGPAKGKDFATSIGPWLVTPDELEGFKKSPKENHTGTSYDLRMTCRVNGVQVSEGSVGDMDWTFAEIIERCAYGVDVLPGDVIGSGTVGTGCFLELNGTGLLNDPGFKPQWLQAGDVVELEIDGLGVLRNVIAREETNFSILALKKTA